MNKYAGKWQYFGFIGVLGTLLQSSMTSAARMLAFLAILGLVCAIVTSISSTNFHRQEARGVFCQGLGAGGD